MQPFANPNAAVLGGPALPTSQGIADFLQAGQASNQASQSLATAPSFATTPGASPDQSMIPQFKAPSAISAPTLDFGTFGTDQNAAASAVSRANASLIQQEQDARNNVFGQYQGAIGAFGPGGAAYNASNIPLYQQQMNTLSYLLGHLKDDVASRLQGGTRVTSAVQDKLYADEQSPLNQNLTDIGRLEGTAQTNLNTAETNALKPIEAYLSSLDSSFSNVNSLFKDSADRGLTGIQSLLDIQQKDKDRAAQLAAARIAANSGANYLGGSAGGAAGGPGTDPTKQAAYNDVATRLAHSNDQELISDYQATSNSANRGNVRDAAKVQFYAQLRPDLFGPGGRAVTNSAALGRINEAPATLRLGAGLSY